MGDLTIAIVSYHTDNNNQRWKQDSDGQIKVYVKY